MPTAATTSTSARAETTERSTLSLSGLLNSLDGVAAAEGRYVDYLPDCCARIPQTYKLFPLHYDNSLLFATTNHLERLDPALSRPGHMGVWVNVAHATKWQAEGIFERFFPPKPSTSSPASTSADAASTSTMAPKDSSQKNVKAAITNLHVSPEAKVSAAERLESLVLSSGGQPPAPSASVYGAVPKDSLQKNVKAAKDSSQKNVKAAIANQHVEEKRLKDGALVVVEGQKRFIDEIISHKKLKQSYEYEVSFKGLSSSENIWLPRDDLVKRGYEKKVLEVDTCEAQCLGLLCPLVCREIESHFADFGLEPEFVSHNTMSGLSGGQKVKIVLGATTWRRHIICLDEPTSADFLLKSARDSAHTDDCLNRLLGLRVTHYPYRGTQAFRRWFVGDYPQSRLL
jgi:hypothetical protein